MRQHFDSLHMPANCVQRISALPIESVEYGNSKDFGTSHEWIHGGYVPHRLQNRRICPIPVERVNYHNCLCIFSRTPVWADIYHRWRKVVRKQHVLRKVAVDDLIRQVNWCHKGLKLLDHGPETRMNIGMLFAPRNSVCPGERVAPCIEECRSGHVSHRIVKSATCRKDLVPPVRTVIALYECPGLPAIDNPLTVNCPDRWWQSKIIPLNIKMQMGDPACFRGNTARFQHDVTAPERLTLATR